MDVSLKFYTGSSATIRRSMRTSSTTATTRTTETPPPCRWS